MRLHVTLASLLLSLSVSAGIGKSIPTPDTGFTVLAYYQVEGALEYVLQDRLTQRCYLYQGDDNTVKKLEQITCPL